MRLSDNDREILACAYFQADAPLSKIADETGIAQHTVRRCLENLLESGYIGRHAYINPARLGFRQYYLNLRVSGAEPHMSESVLRRLSECEHVAWLSEIGAPYPYEVVIYARTAHQATQVFERLTSEVGPLLIEKRIGTLLRFTSFLPKFLSTRSYPLRALSYTTDVQPVAIDELDHKILRTIITATFTSYGQVARALGIAQSTLTYRIDKLKREGLILGEGYLIRRSDLVGMSSFRLLTKLKKYSLETRQRLVDVCDSHHAVYYLEEVLGEYDVELSARVHHPREIPAVIESLRAALPDTFGPVEFYPDIRTFKSENYPFVKMPEPG
jgi:DNA-binding Lrp family transcriptional regulator